jgi:putative Mg2+ transporter-C (MgtC) family protein
MDQIEHLFETLRGIPHAAALAFAYRLALPIGWDRERYEQGSVAVLKIPLPRL